MLAVFGVGPGSLSYAEYVGLTMHLPRLHTRQVLAHAQGVAFAFADTDLPDGLFDGIAETAEQAEDMAFNVNAERRFQRTVRQKRGG